MGAIPFDRVHRFLALHRVVAEKLSGGAELFVRWDISVDTDARQT